MVFEVGDIVIATVERIDKTVVLVKIEDGTQASITMSEIAPGRIRNVRDYVREGKVIICKVLRVQGNHIDLSLRRVIEKEKKEMRDHLAFEKNSKGILRGVLGEKSVEV